MKTLRVIPLAMLAALGSAVCAVAQSPQPVSLHQIAQLVSSDGAANDEFGYSIAMSGNFLVAGAPQLNGAGIGKAYVFEKGANGWADATQIAELTPSDGVMNLWFGIEVAINGNTIVVDAGSFVGSGIQPREYVFVEPASGWADMTETAQLKLSSGDGLGAVAVAGDTIMAAAPEENNDQGVIYVFVKPQGGWRNGLRPVARLTDSDGALRGFLGKSLAFNGNTLVAGSDLATAFVYVRPAGGWVTTTETAALTASGQGVSGEFGSSISMSGATIVVGDAANGSQYYGAAYLYYEPPTGWANATQSAEIVSPNLQAYGYFGVSVGVSGNLLMIGANGETINGLEDVGAVYVFDGTTQLAELTPSDTQYLESMGWSGTARDNTIAAGAVYATVGNNFAQGKVYVFGH
jgi:hypothetical protein